MEASLLDGEWSEAVCFDALGDFDRAILMPAEPPVASVMFVEQQRAYWSGIVADHRGRRCRDVDQRREGIEQAGVDAYSRLGGW